MGGGGGGGGATFFAQAPENIMIPSVTTTALNLFVVVVAPAVADVDVLVSFTVIPPVFCAPHCGLPVADLR
jgi:hypothetical protein